MVNLVEKLPRAVRLALVALVFLALVSIYWSFQLQAVEPVRAAPEYQEPIYTPTAQPDGRIIYIVKRGDTLLSISLITGVSVDDLKGMNNLSGDIITEGQELLLGLGGPPVDVITPGPTPTPTISLPTPTPEPGSGNLCILLFNDVNGDSLRQEEEPSIPDGAISVKNREGTVSEAVDTVVGFEAHCFELLPEGLYTISVAVPAGYNPTTNTSYEVQLDGGDETFIDFGAQVSSQNVPDTPLLPEEGERSPVLGIVGGVIILVGIGLALFAGRLLKGR